MRSVERFYIAFHTFFSVIFALLRAIENDLHEKKNSLFYVSLTKKFRHSFTWRWTRKNMFIIILFLCSTNTRFKFQHFFRLVFINWFVWMSSNRSFTWIYYCQWQHRQWLAHVEGTLGENDYRLSFIVFVWKWCRLQTNQRTNGTASNFFFVFFLTKKSFFFLFETTKRKMVIFTFVLESNTPCNVPFRPTNNDITTSNSANFVFQPKKPHIVTWFSNLFLMQSCNLQKNFHFQNFHLLFRKNFPKRNNRSNKKNYS